jgi:3-deoxy-D-manno-octulosonic-acid transferase
MSYVLNLVYLLALVALSPWLVYQMLTTRKYRHGLAAKLLGRVRHPLLLSPDRRTGPTVWFHGVSVGEIHMLRQLVRHCRERFPEWHCIISSTTDTGLEEARKIFDDLPVIAWPLDFSWAVKSALAVAAPDLVVLAESELWPNFLRLAKSRGVKLALVNGRMSPRSAARYRRLAPLARSMFRAFDLCAVQTVEYAEHWSMLGAPRVVVTGNIKYDGAACDRQNSRTHALRELFNVASQDVVLVAGSTQMPEEDMILNIYRQARERFANVRLVLVPRQRDRFDEVAALLERSGLEFVRRSQIHQPASPNAIILVDTIGELSAVWGLADVAFVGGSLDGKRGGQNMIEPAAYGAAVVFGPHTWNFKDTVQRLLQHKAAMAVQDEADLRDTVLRLLGDAPLRAHLGAAAQRFVRAQQGATQRSCDQLVQLLLPAAVSESRAA